MTGMSLAEGASAEFGLRRGIRICLRLRLWICPGLGIGL